ncbi:MAG: hypothetical protein M3512_13175, partial [Bacteroidota bacterium]|nr:hypothetical protein [Bacteroidota bacterium]
YEWGPAWVNWRTTSGYYGWAPLGPGMYVNMTVNLPINYWVFVPYGYITSPRIYNYYVPRRRVTHVYHQSIVINNVYVNNNYTYVAGPSRNEIERTTRKRVVVREINNTPSPNRTQVNRNSVQIYRPNVSTDQAQARPSRVATEKEIPSRRSAQTTGNLRDNNNSSRTSSSPQGRRSNVSGDNPEINAQPREGATRNRTATQEPSRNGTRRSTLEQNPDHQPVQRQERQAAPAERRQETQTQPIQRQERQAAPAERRQETQTQPIQRQERQAAPAERRQETQNQPIQRQEKQTAPAERRQEQREEPAQRQETQSTPA